MPFKEVLAEQGGNAINSVVQAGMGMALAGWQDKRQLKQQDKLSAQQVKYAKEMGLFNTEQQMKMWNDTNYGAQMKHLKAAGLNPGLIYGMGGAGGATTGSSNAGISGGGAPAGGGEVQAMMGMGMQREMLQAQKDVLESQAEKNRADAAATAGVETDLKRTQITSLSQGIENAKAAAELTKADTYLRNLQGTFTAKSMDDNLDQIAWNVRQAERQVQLAEQEVYIGQNTINEKIDIIRKEAIGAGLRNILTKAQTGLTNAQTGKVASDIRVNEAQISKWSEEIAIQWASLDRQERELKIKDFEAELKEKQPGILNVLGGRLNEFIENIYNLTPRKGWKPGGVKSEK